MERLLPCAQRCRANLRGREQEERLVLETAGGTAQISVVDDVFLWLILEFEEVFGGSRGAQLVVCTSMSWATGTGIPTCRLEELSFVRNVDDFLGGT